MPSFDQHDQNYMARAIRLAAKGIYSTHPNPRVGCVLVKNNVIIGEGFHLRAGEGHAEVNALAAAGGNARGATAYVTLEPCSHHGRTPPCAQALVDAGVSKVISAMQDPNPLVAGRGHALLQQAGIEVQSGLLEAEAKTLNPGFIKRMSQGLPLVRIKQAMSLDGRTAMASGESQWITGAAARSDVQRLRARSSAIITGVGTVIDDNPAMTLRADQLGLADAEQIIQRQPLRVIMDSTLRTPIDRQILQGDETVIFYCSADNAKLQAMKDLGIILIQLKKLEPLAVLSWLAKERDCNEVLIEAGAKLSGAFTQSGLVDEWRIYIAPKLLGSDARPLFELPGMKQMSQQIQLQQTDLRMVGDDIRITYKPKPEEH
ncbi:MAG: bifunctional diaminohydroxyphosphoribosylaminopyrimidine deaminase/5-amino-6-(5-phosphoribosylamino)uracil reductase RibD [Motiliproteus sp.]